MSGEFLQEPDWRQMSREGHLLAAEEWDVDPTVWQTPDAQTPYALTIAQDWDEKFVQTETATVLDRLLQLEAFQTATSQFRMYLESILMARWVQLAPDRVDPVELAAFEAMPLRRQLVQLERLEALATTVFNWMAEQGMDPMPGHHGLPQLVTPQMRQKVAYQRN